MSCLMELLQKLFGVVYIPKAVYRELIENRVFSEEVRMVQEFQFLYVEEVDNGKSVTILRNFIGLDAGEREAIILADEKYLDVLLFLLGQKLWNAHLFNMRFVRVCKEVMLQYLNIFRLMI